MWALRMLYGRRCNVLPVINLIEKATTSSERSGEGEIMVIIACVRHQLSVMGIRTQYASGPDNPVKLKANLVASILANIKTHVYQIYYS